LSIIALTQIFPILWLINYSLGTTQDIYSTVLFKIPDPLRWKNYVDAWVGGNIPHYLLNSVIVNAVVIIAVIYIALTVGYACARMHWKLRGVVLILIMMGMLMPLYATLLPNYKIFNWLGIRNSYWGLIIPYTAFSMPLAVYIMTGFLKGIPTSLLESAVIDGCGTFRIIFQIITPLTKPAIVTFTVMTFLSTWNEFIMAVLYLDGNTYRTLPFVIYAFKGLYTANIAVQFAVYVLAAIPSLIVYFVLNEQITKGVTAGALKG